MAFLDKLTDAAAKVTDAANDAVEITKVKTKINGEQTEIEAELAKLGRIYYEKAKAGAELPTEEMEIVNRVSAHYDMLADLEKQLSEI